MSDWQEQVKKMYGTWTETQKSLLESWTESVRSLGDAPDTSWWDKTMDTWEKTVENAFSSQAEMTESFIGNMAKIEGLPEQAVEALERFQEMAEHWQGTQQDLWGQWFEMIKRLSPAKPAEQLTDVFQKQVKTWQQASEKVMEAQEEWMKLWTGGVKEVAKEG